MRVLVVGGSLGAQALNQNLPLAVAQLASTERPVIRHQTGPRDLVSVQAAYAAIDANADVNARVLATNEFARKIRPLKSNTDA